MDINMPVMDGCKASKIIKDRFHDHVTIISVTAFDD